jgi:hypothetical protein
MMSQPVPLITMDWNRCPSSTGTSVHHRLEQVSIFIGIRNQPKIKIIRFGWLDHSDWIAQRAATGQQARLRPEAYQYKLLELYRDT